MFLQTDPIPGGSANAYDYANQDPTNKLDLNGKGGGAVHCPNKKACEKRAKALTSAKLPAYFYGCASFFFVFQVCGDLTSHGHLIVTGGAGPSVTPFGASMGSGWINKNPNPTSNVIDSYLEHRTLSGGGGAIFGGSAVWGNEGGFGSQDYGGEFGVTTPGFGIYQSYGVRLF